MDHILRIHSSTDGHLRCFNLSAPGNDAAVNMGIQLSLLDSAFKLSGKYPEVQLLGHRVLLLIF